MFLTKQNNVHQIKLGRFSDDIIRLLTLLFCSDDGFVVLHLRWLFPVILVFKITSGNRDSWWQSHYLITFWRKLIFNSFRRGPYHIETSPLICFVNQWTGFYMTRTSVMKELNSSKILLKPVCSGYLRLF